MFQLDVSDDPERRKLTANLLTVTHAQDEIIMKSHFMVKMRAKSGLDDMMKDDHKLTACDIIKKLVLTAIPASLGILIGFSQETINLIFVGSLNDPPLLAALGLGNLFVNIGGYAVFYGLNGAMETFVAQAKGAGDLYQCGIYLQRGRIVVFFMFLLVALVLS